MDRWRGDLTSKDSLEYNKGYVHRLGTNFCPYQGFTIKGKWSQKRDNTQYWQYYSEQGEKRIPASVIDKMRVL